VGEVVRFPRRRRSSVEPKGPAELRAFPDRIGLTAPPFDPANADHQWMWSKLYAAHVLPILVRDKPEGHPLRAWWQAEFNRVFPRAER